MGRNTTSHGVSPKTPRKRPHKTQKRLDIKKARQQGS